MSGSAGNGGGGKKPSKGDRVVYKGEVYYFEPNGGSCRLYRTLDDLRLPRKERLKKAVHSPSVSSVKAHVEDTPATVTTTTITTTTTTVSEDQPAKEASEAEAEDEETTTVVEPNPCPDQEQPDPEDETESEDPKEEQPEPEPEPEQQQQQQQVCFFYVGTDVQPTPQAVLKSYKAGISKDLSKRIRSYHTLHPGFEFFIVARCPSFDEARRFEDLCKRDMKNFRDGNSEVYLLQSIDSFREILWHAGYRMGPDGVFVNNGRD